MLRGFAQNRFFSVLTIVAVAFCLSAAPAQAKKHGSDDTSDKGGLFQPPTAIEKPALVLDMSMPKVADRPGDMLREAAPAPTPASSPAGSGNGSVTPVKAVPPTHPIENMRLHSLFE